jgi:lipid-binding SYLF domain-containing protein
MTRITRYAWTGVVSSAAATLVLLSVAIAPLAWADTAQDARQLVEKARLTFESFQADSNMGPSLHTLLRKAKGVMIYPQVLRGAFLVGAAGGNGVFLVRAKEPDVWTGPAFYTLGQASFGFQAGGDAAETVVVALTDRGVQALLHTSGKLGANASVAVGPVGVGAEAATANLSVDLVSYTRNKGLYAGVSLEGAIVGARDEWNRSYYGKAVAPADILIEREVSNPHSAELIAAVARAAGAGGSASLQGSAAKAQ